MLWAGKCKATKAAVYGIMNYELQEFSKPLPSQTMIQVEGSDLEIPQRVVEEFCNKVAHRRMVSLENVDFDVDDGQNSPKFIIHNFV